MKKQGRQNEEKRISTFQNKQNEQYLTILPTAVFKIDVFWEKF